jgi:hypothetical protein
VLAPTTDHKPAPLYEFATSLIAKFGNQSSSERDMITARDHSPFPVFPTEVFGAQRLGSHALASGTTLLRSRSALFDDSATSNQREITAALKSRLRRNLVVEAWRLIHVEKDAPEALRQAIQQQIKTILDYLTYSLGLWDTAPAGTATPRAIRVQLSFTDSKTQATQRFVEELAQPGQDIQTLHRRFKSLYNLVDVRDSLSSNAPRVAAADQMIKRYIVGFETDLDHFFLEPMLEKINGLATGRHINFGNFETKSLIATNRLLARVEAVGSASIQESQGADLLQDAAVLATLINQVRGGDQQKANDVARSAIKEGAGGAVTTAAGAGLFGKDGFRDLTGFGAVGLLVGALLDLPDEPRGTIYSLGTGGMFKVTPIFDPSGQGLRFAFNYAQTTMIQNADSSVDALVPRIDRFTTNTEVSITNLDMDVISSFSGNYRVGSPRLRTGGIPILKDLPLLKEIPIVGYFVDRPHSDPVRQHTLIFAQTSMYPTVADIVNLMLDTPPGGDVAGKLEPPLEVGPDSGK